MTIGEKFGEIKRLLAGTGEGEAEAKTIMAHVYRASFSDLFLRFQELCDSESEIDGLVGKRMSGMPLAYAMNSKQFYGYNFYVDKNVLIPRLDSECVASHAVDIINVMGYSSALDLCCGSGCLGITLLKESGIKNVIFSDISKEAVDVARRNAEELGVSSKSVFVVGDLFENIEGRLDIIICNPPYVSPNEYEALEPQVRDYEPRGALLAGEGGYAFYERIIKECGAHLEDGGTVVFETGCAQAGRVSDLLNDAGFVNIVCGQDLAGRPRFVSGEKIDA